MTSLSTSGISPGTYILTASGAIGPGQGAESEIIEIVVDPAEAPSAIIVQPESVSLWVGDVAPLRVVGRYRTGPDLELTSSSQTYYSSEATAIATVDKVGRITAVAPGSTTIVVGAGGTSRRLPVTVLPFVKVIPANRTLYAGQSAEFVAQVRIRSGYLATWSISPNVGSIASTASDTAVYAAPASIGIQQQVTVTATSVADPTKSATAVVTLRPR